MERFIKVTELGSGRKYLVPVERIDYVMEIPNGSKIVFDEKYNIVRLNVKESLDEIDLGTYTLHKL